MRNSFEIRAKAIFPQMYIWIHAKYTELHQRQTASMAEKEWFWYNKINSLKHVWHCGAVDKELLARADEPGSTPGDTVFCFFVPFFSV